MRAARALTVIFLLACGDDADRHAAIEGAWRLAPERSRYEGTAEARSDETFDCETHGNAITCRIHSVRVSGDTTTASFEAKIGEGAGTVAGIDGVGRVLLVAREDGYDAVFLDRTEPILGYRIHPYGDSLVVRTTDPATGEPLGTRVVYVRARR